MGGRDGVSSPRDRTFVQPIIDIHVHIMPYGMMKPSALDLMKRGRKDYAEVERYSADPKAFLAFMDSLGVERAGLINYVAPQIMGFAPSRCILRTRCYRRIIIWMAIVVWPPFTSAPRQTVCR